ncbi:MAG TPA: flagellar basal body-associated FliL family protein [Candidatus Sulfotelmatobacter sp.]
MADAKQVAATVPAKGGWRLGPMLFFLVLAVLGVWWWSTQQNGADSRTQQNSPVKSTLHLETFVVNLADRDQRSYLRVGVDLGLNREFKHGEEAPVAHVRDTILEVLAGAKADDLLTPEGKSRLKADLLQALKESVPELGVREVYFTELLIQK